jgi:UDP-2,3-diacylglucosamine hydrolase
MSTAPSAGAPPDEGPLAIICGGGSLPFAVADAAKQRGRGVVLLALRGSADAERVAGYRHHWVAATQVGTMCRLARRAGCRDLVFIGGVVRPSFRDLRPDVYTLPLLPRLFRMLRGGDSHLLSGVAGMFEEQGFRVLGAHDVAPQILLPEGPVGRYQPNETDRDDIALGLAFLRAIGPFDVGQAVVMARRRVLAVEAAEGTDIMLARLAELRSGGRVRAVGGVLVKAPTPGQDRRMDLPTIGPQTIESAARAGLGGIAVVAGSTVVAEPERIGTAADRERLFVVGVRGETAEQ